MLLFNGNWTRSIRWNVIVSSRRLYLDRQLSNSIILCGSPVLRVCGASHELKSDARQVERLGGVGEVDQGVHLEGPSLGVGGKRKVLVVEGKPETRALSLWTRCLFLDISEGELFFARRNDSNNHRGPRRHFVRPGSEARVLSRGLGVALSSEPLPPCTEGWRGCRADSPP